MCYYDGNTAFVRTSVNQTWLRISFIYGHYFVCKLTGVGCLLNVNHCWQLKAVLPNLWTSTTKEIKLKIYRTLIPRKDKPIDWRLFPVWEFLSFAVPCSNFLTLDYLPAVTRWEKLCCKLKMFQGLQFNTIQHTHCYKRLPFEFGYPSISDNCFLISNFLVEFLKVYKNLWSVEPSEPP